MAAEISAASAAALPPYLAMFREFAESRIDPAEFEKRYLVLYLNDPTRWDEFTFDALDRVFADVDAYVENDDDRLGVIGGIDAEQLRQSVRSALTALDR